MASRTLPTPKAKTLNAPATLRVRRDVGIRYFASGLLMCAAAAAVFAIRPAQFGKSYYDLFFYVATAAIALLSIARCKTCNLSISSQELRFYNGIIDTKRIPVSDIERVEYNPEIRIRIYMRSSGRRTVVHKLPNVFSAEETADLLGWLEREHHVPVEHITRHV